MKPTQMECGKGSLNQIPPYCVISGDIRLTPFYDVKDVYDKMEAWVKDLNENIDKLPTRGPMSKYTLEGEDIDIKRGKIELEWGAKLDDARDMEGIACNMESKGFAALCKATEAVKGKAVPYAITGSLPLVRKMQREGFDLQITGYGLSKTYHADNEYCLLSDMSDAFAILVRLIELNDK
uniref:Peptidase M20 dimerisation domain-containing protein n=2 Tax=Lotharella globosa TaxID=91324 RepID=A0A6V3N8G9_9EUKA